MPSQAQLVANRSNALHSTGPRTGPGKAASAQNNLSHGFRSQAVVLPGEDPAEFEELLHQLTLHFSPIDFISERCVNEMACAEWRLARVRRLLHDALAEKIATGAELDPGASPDHLQRLAVEALNESRTSFSTWLRYEVKYQNDYHRAYLIWTNYRKGRQTAAIREIDALVNAPMPCGQTPTPTSRPLAPLADFGFEDPHYTFEANSFPQTPRSAPCPCGSGLKFKRCCGPAATPYPGGK